MVLKLLIPTWTALGFYRGGNVYNYDYKKNYSIYEDIKVHKYIKYPKPQYFYSSYIYMGFFGVFLYVNPLTIPFVILKELYRIEVNLRGLNDEKEKDDYYKLL